MEDYEQEYEAYWKGLVENPDGTINLDQIKRELFDYGTLLREVPKVYDEVAGLSKPHYSAETVLDQYDKRLRRHIDDVTADVLADVAMHGPEAEEAAREDATHYGLSEAFERSLQHSKQMAEQYGAPEEDLDRPG